MSDETTNAVIDEAEKVGKDPDPYERLASLEARVAALTDAVNGLLRHVQGPCAPQVK